MTTLPTMTPVTFDGCFGWLHRPAGARPEMGVVLCNPFGYEALCTYRGWRELAEALAARGIAALRFDYPGTGDSSGNEDDPQRLRAWLDSIKAAAAWLRAETGAPRLSLCGLRLGATLAALAAEEMGGVDNLALLMPVSSGKSYIRELELQHQSWLSAQHALGLSLDAEAAQTVGAHGFRLYPDTLDVLASVDLERCTQRPAQRVLLQDLNESARSKRLAAHYEAQGAQADLEFFGEYGKFLLNPSYSEPPRQAFDRVCEWLGASAVDAAAPAAEVHEGAATARIDFEHGRETPVVFGGGRFAGVLCEPRRALDGAPAVLFVNTGGVHRIGDGRFTVLMARHLAAQGITSLRMDLSGLGDSLRRDDTLTLDMMYARYAIADATAGVDWLAAAGYPRIVMFGVCTGAYVSLHTALAHPAVVGCALVNLPFFTWGGAQVRPGARHVASSVVYRRAMRNPRKWLRLLTGQANGRAITAELARRLCARIVARASTAFERLLGLPTPGGAIRRLAFELERKGVQTTLLYGPLDEGLDELEIHFGSNGNQLGKLKNVTAKVVGKVDHALFSRAARDAVMAQFDVFLRERVLNARRDAVAPGPGLRVARAAHRP
ncbi:MAG TPA: alpha/beta hydrolase family protein [Paraburkholderia sp.]|nr:alpha/beta hydrolase family protein [Paraburkholderia sp.]